MVATKLHATDEEIHLDKDFILLTVDPKTFGLGLDFRPLRELLMKLTKASNMNAEAIDRLGAEDQDLREGLENIEQGVVSYDGRIAECESSCQEVLIKIQTSAAAEKQREQRMEEMKNAANKAKEDAAGASAAGKDIEPEPDEFASGADMRKMMKELNDMKSDTSHATKQLQQALEKQHADAQQRFSSIEADVKNRFDEFVAEKHDRLQGDVEALRQIREKDRAQMAEKREFNTLKDNVEEMNKKQEVNASRFEDAMKDVGRVSEVVQGVEGTKQQLQELWHFTRNEAKETRQLCLSTFEGQRREIRQKAEAVETVDNNNALKRELEDVTARLARLEASLKNQDLMKAERHLVTSVNESLIRLGEEIREKEGVLFGARRCLSCNRAVEDNNDHANQLHLQKERQKQVLLNTIEKAVNDAGTSKVNFLSIEVGKTGMKKGVDGALYHTAEMMGDKVSEPGHITRLTPLQDFSLMDFPQGMTSPSATARSRFNESVPGLQSSRGRSHGKLPYLAPVELSHSGSSPRIGLPPIQGQTTSQIRSARGLARDNKSVGLAAQVQADLMA